MRPSEQSEGASEAEEGRAAFLGFVTREVISAAFAVLGVYVSTRLVRRLLDPNAESRERMRARREEVIGRLTRTGVPLAALQGLSACEENLLNDLVFPEDIAGGFSSVGGLERIKEGLKEIVVYPMMFPEVYSGQGAGGSALLSPPKGVLLYGPPGTGKTMLAKALAKESGANFLALSPSSLLSKWLGETEQLARAVFSLAHRVQPTVIFVDEVDGLFRERSASEHEAHKNLKAEFMQLWDGLTTDDRSSQVIVLGATNRPYDVDPAILRRMPRAFEVALPNITERIDILRTLLSSVVIASDFSYQGVADVTEGYSGSDLKELCRAAMMQPVREALRRAAVNRTTSGGAPSSVSRSGTSSDDDLRPLTLADVLAARCDVTRTEDQSADYLTRSERNSAGDAVVCDIEPFMQFLQQAVTKR